MRTTDERMDEVLRRARAREAADRRRRQRAVAIGGGALSVVAVAVAGMSLASMAGPSAPSPGSTVGLMGSVIAGGSALGYVVAGLLGLALGVAVTVLAFRAGRRTTPGEAHKAREAKAPEDDGVSQGKNMP